MKATEFIYNELNAFIKRFSNARIRYEYDKNALVHVVEVLPNEVYYDSDYIQWENDFYNRFVSQFPIENICFISDDALVCVGHQEFVIEGLEYAPITSSREPQNIPIENICLVPNDALENRENQKFAEKELEYDSITSFRETKNIFTINQSNRYFKNITFTYNEECDMPDLDISNILKAA